MGPDDANVELVDVWDDYYARPGDTAIKDRQFFDLEVATLRRCIGEEAARAGLGSVAVLELGSGTGFLAEDVVDELTRRGVTVRYEGVDFSPVAVAAADSRAIPDCTFHCDDFLEFLDSNSQSYDVILTQRSVMAVMDRGGQERLLSLIRDHLRPGGLGLLSEGTVQGLARVNELRLGLSLQPLEKVWHSQYLDEGMVRRLFGTMAISQFASTYWLITRVIYPYFEKTPEHGTPLHDFAASIDQSGDYCPVRLFAVRS